MRVLREIAEALRAAPIGWEDLWIQTKDQRLVRFVPNPVQAAWLDAVVPEWREGKLELRGKREILLKARQFGFSTLILAMLFMDTVNTPNTTTLVIAQDAESTESLFKIVRRFYDNLPPGRRPRTRYANRRELFFAERNSRILVQTAGKKTAGRSLTIHNLHGSEVAFWKDRELLTGLLQAIPARGFVVLESTANGESGDGALYCDLYREAKQQKNGLAARFYGWYRHDEYEREVPETFVRTTEEDEFAREYLAPWCHTAQIDQKLYWWRCKKAEPGMGTLFAQEFPANDREAFLASGKRFFHEWQEAIHVRFVDELFPKGLVPPHLSGLGGFDWGFDNPACLLLSVVDERGTVITLHEEYHRQLPDDKLAERVEQAITGILNRPLAQVPIYADPAMWARKTDHLGHKIANVNAFLRRGIRMVPASNDRLAGWSNVRRYLDTTEGPPKWYIVAGACPNLVRTLPELVRDKHNTEDADTTGEDHAADTARYMLASRPLATKASETSLSELRPPGERRKAHRHL